MIRRAEEKDLKKIAVFEERLLALHHQERPDIFKEPIAFKLEDLKYLIDSKDILTFVYIEDDEVVAFISAETFVRKHPLLNTEKSCHINDLYVDEDHKRKGIATKLIDHLIEYCNSIDIETIELYVWSFNSEAIALYEKLGFKVRKYDMSLSLKK